MIDEPDMMPFAPQPDANSNAIEVMHGNSSMKYPP
jgi:hypothetical protein